MVLSQSDLYRAFDTPPDQIVEFLVWLAGSVSLDVDPLVADIGAGPGRLFAPLVARGWSITAYEPDQDYFATASGLAASIGTQIIVKHGGFEDISETAVFDMVLGINSSFAHLLTPAQRASGLDHVRRALRPGGLVVLDLPNFPWILEHYRSPAPMERPLDGGNIRLEREHKIDRENSTFTTVDHYSVTRRGLDPQITVKTHAYAIVSSEELQAQLATAGFGDVRDFTSFGSRVANIPGPRLLLVARARAA